MIEIRAVIYKGDIRDYGPGYLAVVPALEDCYAYAKTYEGAVEKVKYAIASWFDEKWSDHEFASMYRNIEALINMTPLPYSKQEVVVSYDIEARRKFPDWAIMSWIGIAVWVVPMVYKSQQPLADRIPAALEFIGSFFLICLLVTTGIWICRKLKKLITKHKERQ